MDSRLNLFVELPVFAMDRKPGFEDEAIVYETKRVHSSLSEQGNQALYGFLRTPQQHVFIGQLFAGFTFTFYFVYWIRRKNKLQICWAKDNVHSKVKRRH